MEPVFTECFSNDIPALHTWEKCMATSSPCTLWPGEGRRLPAMLCLPFNTLSPATIEPAQKGYGCLTMTWDQFHSDEFEIKWLEPSKVNYNDRRAWDKVDSVCTCMYRFFFCCCCLLILYLSSNNYICKSSLLLRRKERHPLNLSSCTCSEVILWSPWLLKVYNIHINTKENVDMA